MGQFIWRSVLTAFALWLTTAVVSGVRVVPYASGDWVASVLSFLAVAAVFAVVNAVLGGVIRVITLPLYIITLGLWAFIVNAVLLWAVSALMGGLSWGLRIDSFWWDAVWAAVVLGLANALVGWLARGLGADR